MRSKTKLTYITNEKVRKATFKKRQNGFLKKLYEISILCGVEACAIIYNPFDCNPEVWPSAEGALQVLSNFKGLPEIDQSNKMMNHESFLRERIAKITEQVKKRNKDIHEKEITQTMFECLGVAAKVEDLNLGNLIDLGWLIDQYLIDIDQAIDKLKNSSLPSGTVVAAKPWTMDPPAGSNEENEELEKQQWFMNWIKMQDDDPQLGFEGDIGMIPPFGDNKEEDDVPWPEYFLP